MTYGIGRVPADVDPVDEAMAEIEAADIMARRARPMRRPPEAVWMVCSRCGQEGYTRGYPFSTLASSGLCDDCV